MGTVPRRQHHARLHTHDTSLGSIRWKVCCKKKKKNQSLKREINQWVQVCLDEVKGDRCLATVHAQHTHTKLSAKRRSVFASVKSSLLFLCQTKKNSGSQIKLSWLKTGFIPSDEMISSRFKWNSFLKKRKKKKKRHFYTITFHFTQWLQLYTGPKWKTKTSETATLLFLFLRVCWSTLAGRGLVFTMKRRLSSWHMYMQSCKFWPAQAKKKKKKTKGGKKRMEGRKINRLVCGQNDAQTDWKAGCWSATPRVWCLAAPEEASKHQTSARSVGFKDERRLLVFLL